MGYDMYLVLPPAVDPDWIEYLKKGAAGNGFTVH
jgi:hypothetical protein